MHDPYLYADVPVLKNKLGIRMRTALVAYNAFFSDGSDFSKKEYLEKIVLDAMTR